MIIELYRFRQGLRRWCYTSADAPVDYKGEVYEPAPIERGDIRRAAESAQSQIEIEAAHTLPLAQAFIPGVPPGRVEVEILSGDGAGFAVMWSGIVAGVQFGRITCRIACATYGDGLEAGGAVRRLTRGCSHPLYSAACGVLRQNWRVDAVLTEVRGSVIHAPEFASRTDGWFVGGELVAGEERRMIVAHAGEAVTLTGGIPGLGAGANVAAYAGCDHTLATCKNTFANTANYGGFPWLPQTNPFTGSII